MNKKKEIPEKYKPSPQEVQNYIALWIGLGSYVDQEHALDRLFMELCPSNIEIESVLLKIAVLNNFYSTNIYDVHTVATHFMDCNIDQRLADGDTKLVDDLAHVTLKNGKDIRFYSFATKYCSHHKPLLYPIYDKYVAEVLKYFRRRDRFCKFKNEDLVQYSRFKSIIDDFMQFYGLHDFNYKQIDKYLWQLGKYYYKRTYKNVRSNYR